MLFKNCFLISFVVSICFWHTNVCAEPTDSSTSSVSDSSSVRPIKPMEGTAWVDEDGMRIAWIRYKHLDDALIEQLIESRVNTVILKEAFHGWFNLESAHWKDGELVIEPNERVLQIALEATDRAAANGIHVLWMASYEYEEMAPHLERLGYHHAYYEGPTRFVVAGPHKDAAALDPVLWKGIVGAFGDLVATESLDHPIEGIMFDTEHYAGGIMYLQGSGFADISFKGYLQSHDIGKSLKELPAGTRYEYLKNHGLLQDFYTYLEEQAYEQGRHLAERWRAINPHLLCGTWPCFDNWFCQGMLRGMGGATRSVGLSGVEYFHGSEQTPAMAEYFESKSRNLKYSPGFYPPYSYTPEQLGQHVANAIATTGSYWMLGPNEAIAQADFREALKFAFEKGTVPVAREKPPVNLEFQIENASQNPVLLVSTREAADQFTQPPKLTLRAAFGGAAVCESLSMEKSNEGHYQARVPLVRKLTDNEFLENGFRSGATYRYEPVPNEMLYEDPHHTKLTDGRSYGFFGTTAVWPASVNDAEVIFDLHRPYRITKIQLSQPYKLEDRNGGPSELEIDLASEPDKWNKIPSLDAMFAVSTVGNPTDPVEPISDKRHSRAWLSWEKDSLDETARWVRVRLHRIKPGTYLSLGQVVISGQFDGEIQASLHEGDSMRVVEQGRRFLVPKE